MAVAPSHTTTQRLCEFVTALRAALQAAPRKVPLHVLSATLADFRASSLEIPGQYNGVRSLEFLSSPFFCSFLRIMSLRFILRAVFLFRA